MYTALISKSDNKTAREKGERIHQCLAFALLW